MGLFGKKESKEVKAEKLLQEGNEHYGYERYDRAMSCYEQAAKLGDADAMYNIAFMYYNGEGSVPDKKKAVHWFVHQ